MKNLELKKAASDLAFDTITTNGPALDAAIAAKAAELQLTDPQYAGFKTSVIQFRGSYAQAITQDAKDAAAAKRPGTAGVPPATAA